ncbi:MAG: hypothetical protein ACYSXD_05925 [Planctomycetota bacterium]
MGRTLKEYSTVSLKAEDLDGQIDFRKIFGRNGPVHIEVGCGNRGRVRERYFCCQSGEG